MLLFTRVVTLNGSPRRTMPWAAEITGYINAHSDLAMSCWAGSFGYPVGTFAWSAIVESQAGFNAATAPLLADSGYLDLLEGAADMASIPGQDQLRQLIHGAPSEPPPLGAVSAVTTATAVLDRFAEALGWAVEIAQYGENLTGAPVAVLTDGFGTMGGITWISVQPDIAAAETAGNKLRSDPEYLRRLGATKNLFIPGSGHVSQSTRIA